jgi:hypothetical protein
MSLISRTFVADGICDTQYDVLASHSSSIRTGRRVVIITDNARYHHARRHKEWRAPHVEDFVLDYLPPYSPELNPIERVWKLRRRLCLHNRYFPVLEEVVAVVETQFENWRNGNETSTVYAQSLKTLCLVADAGYERADGRRAFGLPAVVLKTLKKLSYPFASLVQLGFGGSDRASKNLGDLFMLVAFHIVKNEHRFVALRQLMDSPLQIGTVEYSGQAHVWAAGLVAGPILAIIGDKNLIKRC